MNTDGIVHLPPSIRTKLEEPFPDDQLQTERRHGFSGTSVPWHHIARRLTDVLGASWCYSIPSIVKHDNAWVVTARITVKLHEAGLTFEMFREGVGGSGFDQDPVDDVKSACSDALKRTAVLFGVGAYLYEKKNQVGQLQQQAQQAAATAVQPFQLDAVKKIFAAYQLQEDYVMKSLNVAAWDMIDPATITAILTATHPFILWLRQNYPNVEKVAPTGGLKTSNA